LLALAADAGAFAGVGRLTRRGGGRWRCASAGMRAGGGPERGGFPGRNLPITKVRSGPNWANIGLAQEALVGVKHSFTLWRAAQARMAGVLLADRLSRIT
jgi:hypothetical protein